MKRLKLRMQEADEDIHWTFYSACLHVWRDFDAASRGRTRTRFALADADGQLTSSLTEFELISGLIVVHW